MKLILASASPRRRQMLADLGVRFSVVATHVDESRKRGEAPVRYATRVAAEKAAAAAARMRSEPPRGQWAVLAADTTVAIGRSILGKPKSRSEAVRMLRRLSGRTHCVITGFCWQGSGGRRRVGHVRTKVTFARLPETFWSWYASTGEPMDKAGAYAAQGIGMSFIERVRGSYSNVVGLPLAEALAAFRELFGGDLRDRCGQD